MFCQASAKLSKSTIHDNADGGHIFSAISPKETGTARSSTLLYKLGVQLPVTQWHSKKTAVYMAAFYAVQMTQRTL